MPKLRLREKVEKSHVGAIHCLPHCTMYIKFLLHDDPLPHTSHTSLQSVYGAQSIAGGITKPADSSAVGQMGRWAWPFHHVDSPLC